MDNTRKRSSRLSLLFSLILMSSLLLDLPALAMEKTFTNSLGMEFVLIPAGNFIMGSPPGESYRNINEVQHKVTISKPFYMQTTEVTLEQWWAIMGKKFFGARKGPENMPVVKVSWHDCIEFIDKLNALNEGTYRLPTEAEWEYACRAGSSTAYNWGDTIDCEKAMYHNNTLKSGRCVDYVKSKGLPLDSPAPVKSYKPNTWGLYDMHGNVWEWCADWFRDYDKKTVKDPMGPASGTDKVRRGGSWFRYGASCRSANRAYGHSSTRYKTTGFRVVREAD